MDELLDEPAVQGLVVHLRDVTERRRTLDALEANESQLASLIRTMRTAVVLEDEHRRIMLANQAFVDLFHLRFTVEELTGRSMDALERASPHMVIDPPDAQRMINDVRASRQRVEGVRFVLYDGRTLECDFAPVHVHGAQQGYLAAYRDVTSQALAEAERERLLASEREENRRLAELDAYRSESIAAVSHELRTPLTSIVGYTQLLRSMLDPARSSEELVCLDAIVRNVDRLLRLAGEVVALDSLESRTLPLPVSPVDVGEVLGRAVGTIGPEASAKGISVSLVAGAGAGARVGAGIGIQGDEDRLAQLFENLLSNAVKFTPQGGHVSVRAEPVDGGWEVTVADSGIGIPRDELELLFTRFFRASNARTRGFPGSGLGLSLARAIAERHGGSISVDSEVGVGTTVRVRIGDAPTGAPAPGTSGDQLEARSEDRPLGS
jgi:PAS domain S-box-containing protein